MGRPHRPVEIPARTAQQRGHLVVHMLDHLLARTDAFKHILPQRLLFDPRREIAHDLEVDVGFEQGKTHFAQRVLHVALRQPPMAAQAGEDLLKRAGKTVEHAGVLSMAC